jgi:hypothetical protein
MDTIFQRINWVQPFCRHGSWCGELIVAHLNLLHHLFLVAVHLRGLAVLLRLVVALPPLLLHKDAVKEDLTTSN